MLSRNICFLSFLYFLQGLPYGLQSRFLPLYFRTHGMSLSHISFFKLLLIPWMLKALWAPFVDRYGTKKLWLAYSMFGLFLTCILGSFTDPKYTFLLGFVLFLFNFLTATQDIAVDGLAIQVLAASELASGNIAQVVGYKFGAIFSGGFITWLGELYGLQWGTIFVGLAIFYLMAYLLVVKIVPTENQDHKPPKEDSYKKSDNENDLPQEKSAGSVSKGRHWIIKHFQFVLHTQETKWTLLYVLVYKLGEQGALTLVPLFLVDQAVPASSVGFWTGLVGQTVSILGSLLGGWLVACFRITPYRGILLFSLFRIVLLAMVFISVLTWPSVDAASYSSISYGVLVGLMCTMLLGSGVITTTTFTLMMFCSQRSPSAIQASHYTTMATVEVLGKLTFSVLIGSLADMFGYSLTFLLFVMLAIVVLPVILKCPQSLIDMFER
ncbi:major facilitator superfamily domain-containing protein 3-like [Dreissena polymorpha]|nr:major facilitator superfamily domain-containing protein 3-like [Dreissena polymorpha]